MGSAAPLSTLKFLCVADEMQEVKPKLPRMVVPRTADGFILPKVSAVDPHVALNRNLRPRQQKATKLLASSTTGKGYDVASYKPAYGTSTNSLQQQPACSMEGDIFSLCKKCRERIQYACALVMGNPLNTAALANTCLASLCIVLGHVNSKEPCIKRSIGSTRQFDDLACP